MNVIIVAVCVNIALVNANDEIDLDTIKRILKGRRLSYKPEGADESVEVTHIIPGFYLESPKTVSKSLFRYPETKHSDVYGRLSMGDSNRHDEKKSRDPNSNSRNDQLTSKVAVKSLDRFRAKKKYEQAKNRSSKSDNKLLVENLLSNVVLGERNINNFRESGNDKSVEISTSIGSKTAATLLVEKLLAKILYGIKTNNAVKDSEIYKYGTTEENIWSSGPRYENILQQILEADQHNNKYQGKGKGSSIIVVETKPSNILRMKEENSTEDILNDSQSTALNKNLAEEIDNNGNEILDDLVEDGHEFEDTYYGFHHHTRRKGDKDIGCNEDASLSSDTEGSSELEKNPGNPFTVHKNKYKQNWIWNHYMDGDHMNINPYGPQFASIGPSGPELFFGRKWWYFNQDDYKPMG